MRLWLVVSFIASLTTVSRGQVGHGTPAPVAPAAPPVEYEYEPAEPGQPTEFPPTTTSTTSTTAKPITRPTPRYPYRPYQPYQPRPYQPRPYQPQPYRPPVRPPYVPGRPWGPPLTFATWNPKISMRPVTGPVKIYSTPPPYRHPTAPPSNRQAPQPPQPPIRHPGQAAAGPAGPAGPYVPPPPPPPPPPTQPPTTTRRPGQIGLKISGGITSPPPPPQGSCPKFTHHISGNKIVIETVPGRCQMLLSWLPLTAEQQKRMNIISAGLASVLYKETKPRTLG